jgi:hypothetical protein
MRAGNSRRLTVLLQTERIASTVSGKTDMTRWNFTASH